MPEEAKRRQPAPGPASSRTECEAYAEYLKGKIDHFELTDKQKKGEEKERQDESDKRVERLLGAKGRKKLYAKRKGAEKEAGEGSTAARERFIDYLMTQVLIDPDKSYEMYWAQKMRELHDQGKIDEAQALSNLINAKSNERAPISMEGFLGEEGIKLFKKAVEEEADSKHYRNAVFLESLTHFPGKKWVKRLILWIGGVSASGKTFSAEYVINKLVSAGIMKGRKKDKNSGNDVIFVDGETERKMSQMRVLVLRAALKKGHPGIGDLNDFTHFRIKNKVQEAALAAPGGNLNIAICETFSKTPIKKRVLSKYGEKFHRKIRKYGHMKNSKQVFSEVVPEIRENVTDPAFYEVQKTRFRNGVAVGGEERAFTSDFQQATVENYDLDMNNRELPCNSKAYGESGFNLGKRGSREMRQFYQEENQKDAVYVPIINDRMPVVLNDAEDDWIEYKKTDKAAYKAAGKKVILVSTREYEQWLQAKREGHKDPTAWLKHHREVYGKSPPIIHVIQGSDFRAQAQEVKSTTPVVRYFEMSDEGRSELKDALSGKIGSLSRIANKVTPTDPMLHIAEELIEKSQIKKAGKQLENALQHKKSSVYLMENTGQFIGSTRDSLYLYPKADGNFFFYAEREDGTRDPNPQTIKAPPDLTILCDQTGDNPKKCKDQAICNYLLLETSERNLTQKEFTLTTISELLALHEGEPMLDENGELASWLREVLTGKSAKIISNFFKEFFRVLRDLTFTKEGEIQPWLIDFIGWEKFKALEAHPAFGQSDILFQCSGAIRIGLSESIRVVAERLSEQGQSEVSTFLNVFSSVFQRQSALNSSFMGEFSKLEKLQKERLPDTESEQKLSQELHSYGEKMKHALMYPYVKVPETTIDAVKKSAQSFTERRIQAMDNRVIINETVESKKITTPSSPSPLFSHPPAMVALSSPTATKGAVAPQKHEIKMKMRDGQEFKDIIIEEHVTHHTKQPVSDLKQLDPHLDPVKVMAQTALQFKDAKGQTLALFKTEGEARHFFNGAMTYLREKYAAVSQEGLEKYLQLQLKETHPAISREQIGLLATTLIRAYKLATEQLSPRDTKSVGSDPYQAEHWPSDAYIRLAKRHLDSCRELGDDEKAVIHIGRKCFDPHYIQALMLVSHACKYPDPQYDAGPGGWKVAEFSASEKEQFKTFYEGRFKALDDKLLKESEATKGSSLTLHT